MKKLLQILPHPSQVGGELTQLTTSQPLVQLVGAQFFIVVQSLNADPPSSFGPVEKIPKSHRFDPVWLSSLEAELIEEENNLLPPYVSPRRPGAVAVTMNIPELLEEPTIPEGITKAQDGTKPQDFIMTKLQVLMFEDYDTRKLDISRDQFMVVKSGQPPDADVVSALEYACGWEHPGILNLFLIPHFGCSGLVEMYVKQLLVCFHGGYL